ncbi:MAG: DUF983 domain-containing protein [Cyclobacteriaceae bacterium]|jgi:uncharacterized protein (DUF983 family)|nr:DUF983 domain-containing protein [Cyclobacteriaceae bacterium]
MIKKGTKLYSIIHQKCPRCQNENLFVSPAYSTRFTEMPDRCVHCGLSFQPEPSFYTGAMYVSYAFQVALFTTVYVALRVLFNPSMMVYIITTIAAAIVLLPVTLRLSRTIYINFFYKYHPELDKLRTAEKS